MNQHKNDGPITQPVLSQLGSIATEADRNTGTNRRRSVVKMRREMPLCCEV